MSASGKTTIGEKLFEKLNLLDEKWIFLDGDTFRNIFGEDLGHSIEDRRKNAYRISRFCEYMNSQGVNVLACVLSIFHNETLDDFLKSNLVLDTKKLSLDDCMVKISDSINVKDKNIFNMWNIKKQLIEKKEVIRSFEERDIIYLKMGKNIGFEQDGKGNDFLRPVLILKKFNNYQFVGFAMTSKKPNNKNQKFYFKLKEDSYIILSQIRTYSAKRISHIIGKVSNNKLKEINKKFSELVTP